MSKKPLILGIESSCDETAASIISENEQGNPIVLSNIISSQVDIHKEFGGVVPELAARSHIEKIDWIVQKAIDDSGKDISEIDAIASKIIIPVNWTNNVPKRAINNPLMAAVSSMITEKVAASLLTRRALMNPRPLFAFLKSLSA